MEPTEQSPKSSEHMYMMACITIVVGIIAGFIAALTGNLIVFILVFLHFVALIYIVEKTNSRKKETP